MLFTIDESIFNNLNNKSNTLYLQTINVISKIFDAWRKGDHLVFCSNRLINKLLRENFSQYSKQVMKIYQARLPQMGMLRDFSHQLRVVDGTCIIKKEIIESKNTFSISVDVINQKHLSDKPSLIVENLDDAKAYLKICKAIMHDKRIYHELRFTPENGGGDTTAEVYNQRQIENDRFCLAISDSDKHFPDDSQKGTAEKLKRVHNQNIKRYTILFSDYFVINAREIENILPTSILCNTLMNNTANQRFASWIFEIEKSDPMAKLFIDMKKGIDVKKIIDSKNIIEIEYWIIRSKKNLVNCSYLKNRKCQAGKCMCFSIAGFGKHTLKNSLPRIQEISDSKFNDLGKLNSEMYGIWLEISTILCAWFCAATPTNV